MASANRLQLAYVMESTAGVTPATPRMKTARITSESLTFGPQFIDSEELRSDRMNIDPILQTNDVAGGINGEFSYPADQTWLGDLYKNAFFAAWSNTPQRDNDGTADSVITDIGTVANTLACTTGPAFVVGHLVKTTGFATAANNTLVRVTTGGATSYVATGSGYVAEAVPPAAARAKVVGFQGASGDITATATGLASTALDFTTLGLPIGGFVKIGGTAAGDRFATAALNDWARITAVAANALTLDNLPSGWGVDAGTGKTLKVWFGDEIKNGITPAPMSIEKGFLDQSVPTYLVGTGEHVAQFSQTFQTKAKVTWSATMLGMTGSQSTVTLDASVDAPTTSAIMASHANVGRISDAGAAIIAPNWGRMFDFTINNNLEALWSLDAQNAVGVNVGECTVNGNAEFYFGSNAMLAKFYAGTPSALNARLQKNSQAVVFQFPRVTYNSDGNPQAGGKNQQITVKFGWKASKDTLTGAHIIVDRFEYYE